MEELFIESLQNGLLKPNNIRKSRNNSNKNENLATKEIKSWDDRIMRVQVKGFCFVVLSNNDYETKVQHQIDCGSFRELDIDISKNFEEKVNIWISKWSLKGVIDNNWKRFINPVSSTPEKMYGLVKTHKVNLVRVITSVCNTTIKNLSIYIEYAFLSRKYAV